MFSHKGAEGTATGKLVNDAARVNECEGVVVACVKVGVVGCCCWRASNSCFRRNSTRCLAISTSAIAPFALDATEVAGGGNGIGCTLSSTGTSLALTRESDLSTCDFDSVLNSFVMA